MTARHASDAATPAPLPCDGPTWRKIAVELELSPQQKRIVELILCGKSDKEIAQELDLTVPTIRTYLKRIYARLEVSDRLALVLRIFALASAFHGICTCRQQG